MKKNCIGMLRLVIAIAFAASALMFCACAETHVRDAYTLDMEYLPEEQALRISQRLVYINRSEDHLESVVFNCAGNMFRRESALMYESDDLEKVFFDGYAPGGVDIGDIRFDGEKASWGMQGENEMFIRVDCDIAPGESGVFEFDYYLLLMRCSAFIGAGDTDVRLSAFYFIPGVYDDNYGEFRVNQPLSFTRWLMSDAADYEASLAVPENYAVISTGNEIKAEETSDRVIWNMQAENVREFSLSFGKRYRMRSECTDSGVEIRSYETGRGDALLKCAVEAVGICEKWFGKFPVDRLDIVESDYALGTLNHPGVIWISGELLNDRNELERQIRFCVAQQYFGFSAYAAPVSDAWMSDSVCEYLSYLMIEEKSGNSAFLKAVNDDWVSSLQLTIPGGLVVTSDASLFESDEYDIVVKKRGAVVMHELRTAMGRDAFIDGLRILYEMGRDGHVLSEMELVEAFDRASGGSWEAFLTDWVFNVGDYVNQSIYWFE